MSRKARLPVQNETSASGTTVWTGRALQVRFDDLEGIGLALLYPALEWNVCVAGHHGYPRASDLTGAAGNSRPYRDHPTTPDLSRPIYEYTA